MKIMTAVCLLCFAANVFGQRLDVAALQSRCLPTVPLTTLNAIIRVESGGNPNAMQIDFPRALLKQWHLPEGTLRLKRQPATQREALEWLKYFERRNISVDLGLMQVSTVEAYRRGLPAESLPRLLSDPCFNLRFGWQILDSAYQVEVKTYGPGQMALQHAISRYNTGDTQRGIDNGYLARVMAALKQSPATTSPTRGEDRR
jgi:type IV secretion system protein VirB1